MTSSTETPALARPPGDEALQLDQACRTHGFHAGGKGYSLRAFTTRAPMPSGASGVAAHPGQARGHLLVTHGLGFLLILKDAGPLLLLSRGGPRNACPPEFFG